MSMGKKKANAPVTIYTTKTCHFCHMAKDFFTANGIKYEEKDVTGNRDLQREMIDKSGQMGVPVIDIGGEIVVGFNEPRLHELLGV